MMGKYRKLPFGYRMELGRIVVHPDEKPWVEYIFQQYALGASFLELAEYMAEEGIQYEAGKLWNKNIIARMLGDDRYIGERGFPTIVATETLERVKERRESKQITASKTEAQKALRRKCKCRITPHIEQEVLYLLNSLAEHSERITMPQKTTQMSHQQDRLMKELDALLQAANHDKVLLDPVPVAVVDSYGDSTVRYILRVWTKTEDYWDVRNDIMLKIREIFDAEGIEMIHPHIHVYTEK